MFQKKIYHPLCNVGLSCFLISGIWITFHQNAWICCFLSQIVWNGFESESGKEHSGPQRSTNLNTPAVLTAASLTVAVQIKFNSLQFLIYSLLTESRYWVKIRSILKQNKINYKICFHSYCNKNDFYVLIRFEKFLLLESVVLSELSIFKKNK